MHVVDAFIAASLFIVTVSIAMEGYSIDARNSSKSEEIVVLDGRINHNRNLQNLVASAAVRDGPRGKSNPGMVRACHSWQLGSFIEENGLRQKLYDRSVGKHYNAHPLGCQATLDVCKHPLVSAPKLTHMPDSASSDVVTDGRKIGKAEPAVRNYPLQFPDYSDQAVRLQSFKHWGGVLPAQELAEGGFYMIAHRDVVRCFSCNVVVQDWERRDNVIDEHRRHSPDCSFVKTLVSKQSKGTIAKATPIKISRMPSGPELLDLECFHSSKLTSSSLPNNNQENMFTGILHHPSVRPPDEYLDSSGEFFHSPKAQSVDSRSGSPRHEQFRYEGGYCEVEDDIPNYGVEERSPVEGTLCQICHRQKVNCVLLPCGHMRTCEGCGGNIKSSGQPCPQCRRAILTAHHAFL